MVDAFILSFRLNGIRGLKFLAALKAITVRRRYFTASRMQ